MENNDEHMMNTWRTHDDSAMERILVQMFPLLSLSTYDLKIAVIVSDER